MPRTPGARLARCATALCLLLTLLTSAACAGGSPSGRLTVMVPWSGAEFAAFYKVVETFELKTGIQVDVEVTRAQTLQLDAAVAAGAPPDLAVLPSVGALTQYADDGRLQPLDVSTKDYVEPFRSLATVGGTAYAVPVKADVKSLIWYNKATKKPGDLGTLARQAPRDWCLGLASGATSGWPGADWISDILLSAGEDGYKQWLSGNLPWNSSKVAAAWQTWSRLVGASTAGASTRSLADASAGLTAPRPACTLAHGALSSLGFGDSPQDSYDFVTALPQSARRLQVSADFLGMFTKNPAAASFISYLSRDAAQRTWVNEAKGHALSADSQVTPGQYPEPVQQHIAKMLQPGSGYTLCFSAADAMRPDVSAAFYRAVLDYVSHADLTGLLKGLDQVQRGQPAPPVAPGELCATP